MDTLPFFPALKFQVGFYRESALNSLRMLYVVLNRFVSNYMVNNDEACVWDLYL